MSKRRNRHGIILGGNVDPDSNKMERFEDVYFIQEII